MDSGRVRDSAVPDVGHGSHENGGRGGGEAAPGGHHPGEAHAGVQPEADEDRVHRPRLGASAVRGRAGLGDQEPGSSSGRHVQLLVRSPGPGAGGWAAGGLRKCTAFRYISTYFYVEK